MCISVSFFWYRKLLLRKAVPKRIAKQFFQVQNADFALFYTKIGR